MPPKKKKPLKKQPLQKQKQKQSQRVVVNVNQQQRRAPAKRVSQPRQQVVYQPLITTSGSVPVPMPYPIQSTAGFAPSVPTPSLGTPANLSSPVVLPTFAEEPVRVIGGEDVSIPVTSPVKVPTPIRVPPAPTSIITEIAPSLKPPPPTIATTPIIKPPPTPPPPPQSISSLLSDISKETGVTSQSVADFLFKKKKQPQMLSLIDPNQLESNSIFPSTASSSISSVMNVPESIQTDTTKADYLFLDDRSIPAPESVSSMSGFNPPSEKSSIKSKPIIAEPKEVVVLKKPELKRSNPFDIFSDNESMARAPPLEEDIASDVATQGTFKAKPPKKREVVMSSEGKRDVNIIPQDAPAGRRMPPIKEKRSNYQSLGELQDLAKEQKRPITRPNGKKKTRNELLLELSVK